MQAGSTGWAAGSAARINAANALDRALTERQLLPTVSHPGVQHEVVIDAASVSEKGLGKGKPPVVNERMAANFQGSFLIHVRVSEVDEKKRILLHNTFCSFWFQMQILHLKSWICGGCEFK